MKYVSIEDSVGTIQDSMKLYEVKSVYYNRFQEKNIVILIAHAIVRCTYDIFPIVNGM